MVCCKGFWKLICDCCNTPVNQNDNDDFVMQDMYDGTIWHKLKTGITQEVGNYGTVCDTSIVDGAEQNLTDNCFGLHLVINIDWYVHVDSIVFLLTTL